MTHLKSFQVQNEHSRRIENEQLFGSVRVDSFFVAASFRAQIAAHFVAAHHQFALGELIQTGLDRAFVFLALITRR